MEPTERTFQREGPQVQSLSRNEIGISEGWQGGHGGGRTCVNGGRCGGSSHQRLPRNFQLTVHFHLTTLWGGVGVSDGRWEGWKERGSFVHSSNKYFLNAY